MPEKRKDEKWGESDVKEFYLTFLEFSVASKALFLCWPLEGVYLKKSCLYIQAGERQTAGRAEK
ncbi:hypothetical protein CSB45_14990 [candidate division KSB3 bacterium]|uniref:Uncharacterized protein n=1 Tax=candidate division KSB3 bacterium TaxID=2044937 RepID=A0A2G6E0N9_9BACT|nr:MAG: hypothetical protein CSB45_14990 [candidate division KSB3 bacterium]PIE31050.1 MAG: hypothetical protein CSA57_00480 [candidate division KSB3 bacterium]